MIDFQWIQGTDDYSEVLAVRYEVFCNEQHYPADLEQDKEDLISEHLLVKDGNGIIGCGRLLKINEKEYHLGRIAVYKKYRGKGYGKIIINELERKAKSYNAEILTISAQIHAVGFYKKAGYRINSSCYPDENIKHIDMIKSLIFDNCSFMCFDKNTETAIMRKPFSACNVKKATVCYTTAGFSEPYINGKKINGYKFTPVWTNYVNRDLSDASYPVYDTMTARWYYLEYDITGLLNNGENIFTLHIGNGWFRQQNNKAEKMPDYVKELGYIFKIRITEADGNEYEITSNGSEICSESYIVHSNIYMNELTDGRLYYNGIFTDLSNNVLPVHKSEIPETVFEKQPVSGDTVKDTLVPELIYKSGNTKLYKLPLNTSGVPVIKFADTAQQGEKCTVTFAEAIDGNYSLLLRHTGSEFRTQKDEYINGNNNCPLKNIFSWRAGQYVKVEGNAVLSAFEVINSDVELTCGFKSNNETLNWLFNAYVNTQSNNVHSFVPSDCPHRERLGYTGDGQLCSGAVMTMYDSRPLYLKWMRDIADSQDLFSGHIQHTAPFYGGGGGPGGWGGAIAFVAYNYYRIYGDISVVKKYYYPVINYISYMVNHSENGLVVSEEKDGWCLGDWCAPGNINEIPEPFINTYFLIKTLNIAIEFSNVLKKDCSYLKSLLKNYRQSFKNAYYNSLTHSFIGGIQGADAFGIDLDMGDEKTVSHLVNIYESKGQYDTGIFGTQIVTKVLFEKGYPDLAFKLLTNEKETSFFNMKKQDATTLWENWDGCDSHSHPMFGAVCEYLFTYILGIKQENDSIGFKNVKIEPSFIKGLNAEGFITTPNGRITVKVNNGKVNFSIE